MSDEKEAEPLVSWGESDYVLPRVDNKRMADFNKAMKEVYLAAMNRQIFESGILWRRLSNGNDKS